MKTYVSKISVSQDWLQAEIPVIRSRRGPGILSLIPRLDILQASHKSSGAIGGSLRYALSWKHQSTYPLYSAKKSPCVSETEFVFRDSVTRRRTVFLPFRLHILLNFSWRVHTTAQWISMVQRPMCQLINHWPHSTEVSLPVLLTLCTTFFFWLAARILSLFLTPLFV